MTLVYEVGDGLYVNLTNRCPCACTFCLRQSGDSVGGADSLWLEREPTLEEVMAAFEAFDVTLAQAGKTLGLSNTYIFWRIRMPCCRQGILAGTVLSFARALGEYGATSMIAGYTPGRTATISTTVYQLWRTGDDALAFRWVLVNVAISAVVLLAVNMLERRERPSARKGAR